MPLTSSREQQGFDDCPFLVISGWMPAPSWFKFPSFTCFVWRINQKKCKTRPAQTLLIWNYCHYRGLYNYLLFCCSDHCRKSKLLWVGIFIWIFLLTQLLSELIWVERFHLNLSCYTILILSFAEQLSPLLFPRRGEGENPPGISQDRFTTTQLLDKIIHCNSIEDIMKWCNEITPSETHVPS